MKITISGMPGSGKSTVGKLLAKRLGYDHYSTGDLMRRMAKEKGVTLEELQKEAEEDFSIDQELDEYNRELDEKDDFVLDGRIAFHFLSDSVDIYLYVEPEVGAKRILGDERPEQQAAKDVEEMEQHISERIESENERYNKYYGVYIHDPSMYDIVIDTTEMTPEEIVGKIAEILEGEY